MTGPLGNRPKRFASPLIPRTVRGADVSGDGQRFLFILTDAEEVAPADEVHVGWTRALER